VRRVACTVVLGHGLQLCGVTCRVGFMSQCLEGLSLGIIGKKRNDVYISSDEGDVRLRDQNVFHSVSKRIEKR